MRAAPQLTAVRGGSWVAHEACAGRQLAKCSDLKHARRRLVESNGVARADGLALGAAKSAPPLAFGPAGARGADVTVDGASRFDPL
jgi:hypothetical protein